jgi:hypothetical protein
LCRGLRGITLCRVTLGTPRPFLLAVRDLPGIRPPERRRLTSPLALGLFELITEDTVLRLEEA